MANTKAKIEINFMNAKDKAKELEEIAGELERLSKRSMDDTLQQIGANWKGENAGLYLQKGKKVEDEILKTAQDLRNTAATIRRMAQRIYDTEMRVLEIATVREQ